MNKVIIEKVPVSLTPKQVGDLFATMDDAEQALFFNAVAENVKTWSVNFCFQMQAVTDNPFLTNDARNIMKCIGDYSGKNI